MKIVVITPSGELYNEEIDYIVVSSKNNGDFAVLKDHAPLISAIDVGYIKLVKENKHVFIVVINAALENQDNTINVIAQEAHVGRDKDNAMQHLDEVRKSRLEENRRRTQDFLQAEKELRRNIREAQASKR